MVKLNLFSRLFAAAPAPVPVAADRDTHRPASTPAVMLPTIVLSGPVADRLTVSFGTGDAAAAPHGDDAGLPPPADNYTLRHLIAAGGMGAVYRATEADTGRDVAIKYLKDFDAAARARFRHEATVLARLSHDNVVPIYASNLRPVAPYFVMPLLGGGTLATRIAATGGLPPHEAARILAAAARGVHAAHTAGVIHRDIKPSNILLDETGVPRVADFGLARTVGASGGATVPGSVLGTVDYMAPEQAAGRGPAGPAADIYSLGATLFEAVVGRPPFVGAGTTTRLDMVRYEDPPRLRALKPDVPAAFAAIVELCLQKDPEARYPSAKALADDLEAWLGGKDTFARPNRPAARNGRTKTRRWRYAAAAVVALAVAATGAATAGRPKSPTTIPNPDRTRLSLSPDFIRGEWAAGRAVELVGARGKPVDPQWVFNATNFTDGPTTDGAAHFSPRGGPSVLRLADMPPAPWRAVIEIRHVAAKGGGTNSSVAFAGVAFGHRATIASDGTPRHSFVATSWTEGKPKAAAGQNQGAVVRTAYTVVRPQPVLAPALDTVRLNTTADMPAAGRYPAAWRTLEICADRDALTVSELTPDGPRQIAFANDINATVRAVLLKINAVPAAHGRNTAPLEFTPWDGSGGLCIWAAETAVSFRNARIEPRSP